MAGKLAVVLSGGGAKGAFQVGVLHKLIVDKGVDFDIFVGTSTGAIQALGCAMNDVVGLRRYWESIRGNSDIYRKRFASPLGIARAALALVGLNRDGLISVYDARPLRDKLRDYADPVKLLHSGKTLRVAVASLQNGTCDYIAETAPDIAEWVYASCSEPVLFAPHETVENDATVQWVDGGVRDITPLGAAMKLEPERILVVRASPKAHVVPDTNRRKTLFSVGMRAISILSSEVSLNDLEQTDLINDAVKAKNDIAVALAEVPDPELRERILAPLQQLLGKYDFVPVHTIYPATNMSEPHQFDHETIKQMIAAGERYVEEHWHELREFLSPPSKSEGEKNRGDHRHNGRARVEQLPSDDQSGGRAASYG